MVAHTCSHTVRLRQENRVQIHLQLQSENLTLGYYSKIECLLDMCKDWGLIFYKTHIYESMRDRDRNRNRGTQREIKRDTDRQTDRQTHNRELGKSA